jgi:hypothetical protein
VILRDRFAEAPSFPEYLEGVRRNEDLWRGVYERVRIPDELLQEALAVPGSLKILVLSEDWCGDAVNLVPVVARLAELHPRWELRVLGRDANPDIMDAHLTDGRSRSIPVFILMDEDGVECGWWGPRPEEIQSWVVREGRAMVSKERYKITRGWYARDRGRSTIRELLDVVCGACATC